LRPWTRIRTQWKIIKPGSVSLENFLTVTYNIGQKEKDDLDFYAVKKKYAPRNAKEERLTLKNAGIKNGTVITKWNGKTIDSYFDEITYYFNQNPVLANEEFYLPTYVAGIGKNMAYGETYVQGKKDNENPFVTTGFLDENGIEKTVNSSFLLQSHTTKE
jgi:hypothetical protein